MLVMNGSGCNFYLVWSSFGSSCWVLDWGVLDRLLNGRKMCKLRSWVVGWLFSRLQVLNFSVFCGCSKRLVILV